MRTLYFDSETDLIAPGRLAPRLACVTWADDTGNAGIDDHPRRILDALRDPDVLLVGHHVSYDVGVIAETAPTLGTWRAIFNAYDAGRIVCTKINAQLRQIREGKLGSVSLDTEHQRIGAGPLGGKSGADAWRFRYRELIGVPLDRWPEAARSYAITDAQATRTVWTRNAAEVDLDNQTRAAWALHLMGAWGMRTDPDRVVEHEAALLADVADKREELTRAGLFRKDGTKDMQAIKARVVAAYAHQGRAAAKTEKGAVVTDREALEGSGDPLLEMLAYVGAADKELTAFVPALAAGLICPQWNPLVATGRTSCRGPNLQQLPRRPGIRECFIPREGNWFFGADYSIAELRSLAQCLLWEFGHSSMADALNQGMDLHLLTASRILGLSYEETVRRYKAGDPIVKETRQLSKASNFGYPGGLGSGTFVAYAKQYGVTISEARGKELKDLWLSTFPEMRGYLSNRGADCAGGPTTVAQPWSGRLRGGVGYCDGANTRFQGLTADGAKRALYAVTREQFTDPSSPLWGSRCNAFVHDEIIAETDREIAPEAGDRLAEVMVQAMTDVAPDIHHEAEPFVMDRWSKGAKTMRDERGRLCLTK